ncbi:chitin-binding domain protein cbd-1-like isoform X1 [Vespa velutina]|uniref:chitin-binding domain protein cbd-1-like isoform X1 n=2 Tax=Vespa velutina TaxID=202808 RepID=UPI001FB4FF5E|nr:chitin-binding domain protein cbd-1-like isoform X1 [Vespa velutina]
MKGNFGLIAVFAIILAAVNLEAAPKQAAPTVCPSEDSLEETVLLAHESDCSKFYVCFLGEKILKECPYSNSRGDRLHFNPLLQVCIQPENSNCKSTNEENIPEVSIKDAHLMEEVPPSSKIVSSSTYTQGVPDHCPSDDFGKLVHLPHETNCSLFYKCNKGQKILQKCPPGLHFNPVMQICDLPENAKCKNKLDNKVDENQDLLKVKQSIISQSLETEIISTTPGSIPDHCPLNDTGEVVHLPHETDCTLFYKCNKGEKIINQCPPGLHFNPTLQVCDLPEHAKCTSKPENKEDKKQDSLKVKQSIISQSLETEIISATPGSIPDHCPLNDTGEVVHLPHETDCTLFYKCNKGEKIINQCPPGLHFNPTLQVCDLPEHAKCTSKPENKEDKKQDSLKVKQSIISQSLETEIISATPGSIPDHCPLNDTGEVVHLPHETDCTLFYKCNKGEKIINQCPPGLHFNPTLQVCDLPEHAKCTSKPENKEDKKQDSLKVKQSIISQSLETEIISATPGSIPDHCPLNDTGEVVHLPHETDCTLFYKCNKGEKIINQCPPGLHFNPTLQVCDLPEHAKCTSKPENKEDEKQDLPEIKGTSSAAPESSTRVPASSTPGSIPDHCPPDDSGNVVHLPHETNCSLFYKCHEGQKIVLQCPPGLYFNPTLQVCDLPEQANCKSKPGDKEDEKQDLPEIKGTSSAAPESSTRVPASSTPGSIPDHCPPDDSGNVVHLPHETNCSLFYKCHEGQKIVLQCPPGLYFNPTLQVCDLPEQANCKSKPGDKEDEKQDLPEIKGTSSAAPESSTRVPASSTPGSIPDHCPPDDSGNVVHLPHETNCSLFYKCNGGQKIVLQCPPGLNFNPTLQVCDLPEQANCKSKPGDKEDEKQDLPETKGTSSAAPESSTRVPASSTPGSIPDHCPPDDSGNVVHLPHETNCSLFYKCNGGQKIVLQCPPGLNFNPTLQVCDLPEQANCKSKPGDKEDEKQDLPETKGTSSAAPESSTRVPASSTPGSIPDHCPPDDSGNVVHLPHETNCSLFYKCVGGVKVIQHCPASLHFNRVLQVCDRPEHAECTNEKEDKN